MPSKLRVLELYSGIGGMHWALKKSGLEYEVIMAIDINTTANVIYKYNFPSTNLQSFGLEKLTLQTFEHLDIDTILMSPPCQPFTRVGKKRDSEDVRTKSFLHILQLVREMKIKPKFLLVENVKGFETSRTRNILIECLEDCGYTYQEFLLTPLQFGVPNCRLRYYLIARREQSFTFAVHSKILTNLPKIVMPESSISTVSTYIVNHSTGLINQGTDLVSHSTDAISHDTAVISHGTHAVSQGTLKSHACTDVVNLPFEHSSSTLSRVPQCDHICSSTVHSNTNKEPSGEEPLTRQSCSCCYPDTESWSMNAQISSMVECLHDKHTNSTIKEDLCLLKDAGRNMRYCEEEDSFITVKSQPLSDFMVSASIDDLSDYWLSDKTLRMFVVMDIVFPALKKSTCFTKRYGRYVDGAGSVVQMSSNVEDVQAASQFKSDAVKLKNCTEWNDAELDIIKKLKLRYFTPREVANLLCFPPEFDFPSSVSTIQKYRVLGNSLNVLVVAELILLMTQEVGA